MEIMQFISVRKPETPFSSVVKTRNVIRKNGLPIRMITIIKSPNHNGKLKFIVVRGAFRI